LEFNGHFEGAFPFRLQGQKISIERSQREKLLATCFTLASCLTCSSNLKMEAKCSSATLVDYHRTMRCYIPEERTLQNQSCENFKSYEYSKFVLHISSAYYVENVKEEIIFSVDVDDVNFLVFKKQQVVRVREQNAGMSRRRGSLLLGSRG
jgi:ribosomal protein L23